MQGHAIAATPPGWRARVAAVLDTRRGGASHLDALDGVRGIAVASVFFVHYHPWVAQFLPQGGHMAEISARVADVGNAGVDLFFVLSGYLIYGALLRRPQPFGSFMARRLQRLYPTFLVVFLPVLAIELARGAPTLQAGPGLVPNLLGNVFLLAGVLPIDPLIVVAWTLSYEMVFYLLTPLVFRYGRLHERSRAGRLAIVGVVWGIAALPGAISDVKNARMLMFLGGVVVAEWAAARREAGPNADSRWLRRIAPVALVAVPVACYLLTYGGTLHAGDQGVREVAYGSESWAMWARLGVLLVCLPLVVASLVDGEGRFARAVGRPALRSLGTMSYSYYLLHALVIRFVGEVATRVVDPAQHQSAWWWAVGILPVFAATVVTSFILFRLVERPCSLDPDPPVSVIPPRILRWPWERPRTDSSPAT